MRLTKHFTYEEMTHTDCGFDNSCDDIFVMHQLLHTCRVLERVRRRTGLPLPINSGYRSKAVNEAVGGAANSYHCDGRAVDISTIGMSVGKREMLYTALENENPVELYERSTYIHVAY